MILDDRLTVIRQADSARYPIAEGNILNGLLARSIDVPRDFVFPKALLQEIGGYNPSLPLYEDWDLKIRMAARANFYFTGLAGVGYVQHDNGLSRTGIDEHVALLWRIFEQNIHLADAPYVPLIRRQFRRQVSGIRNAHSLRWLRRQAARTGLIHNPVSRVAWTALRKRAPSRRDTQSAGVPERANETRRHVAPVPRGELPIVSVVTVCRNAGDHLRQTMETVLAQTYPAIEYIIIDGGSTDGSIAFIDEHIDRIAHFVSEPDSGIYEAMNKAINAATGEWIIFMNAGDYFASPETIAEVMGCDLAGADLIYGDSRLIQKDRTLRIPARPLDVMWQRISFSHQALFARTSLMKAHPFSTQLRVVADYEFYFKMYAMKRTFRYVPLDIAYILPGGFSEKALWRRTLERWSVVRRYRRGLGTDLFYMKFIAREILRPRGLRAARRFKGVLRNRGDV